MRRCEGTPPTGAGEAAAGTNARVAAGPCLSASTVNTPVAIASATHRRPAASKPLRHAGRQNSCRLPPSLRGAKPLPHQRQTRSPGCVVISKAASRPLRSACWRAGCYRWRKAASGNRHAGPHIAAVMLPRCYPTGSKGKGARSKYDLTPCSHIGSPGRTRTSDQAVNSPVTEGTR